MHLGEAHGRLGHSSHALHALNETVRCAQQSSDDHCLAQALASLCRLLLHSSTAAAEGGGGVAAGGTTCVSFLRLCFFFLSPGLERSLPPSVRECARESKSRRIKAHTILAVNAPLCVSSYSHITVLAKGGTIRMPLTQML